ncbi:hypothetical protein [Nocardia sp. NPDC004722]
MKFLPTRTLTGIAGMALVASLTACNPLHNTLPGLPSPERKPATPEWFSCGVGPFGLAVQAYGMNDDPAVCDRARDAAWRYADYSDRWSSGYQATVVTRTGTWDCGQVSADPVPYQECTLRGSPVDMLRLLS